MGSPQLWPTLCAHIRYALIQQPSILGEGGPGARGGAEGGAVEEELAGGHAGRAQDAAAAVRRLAGRVRAEGGRHERPVRPRRGRGGRGLQRGRDRPRHEAGGQGGRHRHEKGA